MRLFPDHRGKGINILPFRLVLAYRFLKRFFIKLRKLPPIISLLWVFIIKKYWILLNSFCASIKMFCLFPFILLLWHITLIDFQMLSLPCIHGLNIICWWCIIFIFCQIWLIIFYSEILHLCSWWILFYNFLITYVRFRYWGYACHIRWVGKCSILLYIL